MGDKQFVDGLLAKRPHERAPEFVKACLSIKRAELIAWLEGRTDEWLNVDVKEAKSGKWYAELNDFKRKDGGNEAPVPYMEANGVPF